MPTRRKVFETAALKHAGTDLLSASWPFACLLLCLFVLLSYSSASAGDYLLYLPKPVDAIDAPLSGEGLLVKKIMILKGDTLSAISRRFSGKGSYFPQILLFNNISNPNRIYAGRNLLVPVSGQPSSKKLPPTPSVLPARTNARSADRDRQGITPDSGGDSMVSPPERQLFNQAATLFAGGKYREALDGFSRFLKMYPHSSLAPDASLYRADCYLRLSGTDLSL
ncbi:MAG: LysM peptidoglycan-binding domain-containing protein [Deltaproteobacteria bacterium]|nr:LysM peptidoglycan-binding domain-containing protein [Deltaproteobacteria bacterium]